MALVTDPGGFVLASGIPIAVLLARHESHSCPEALTGCRLWMRSIMPQGYGRWNIGQVIRGAHRVTWEIFFGPIPDGMHVLHKCDVRACVEPDHLFLGTNADNIRDRVAKRRTPHGESHYQGKLTKEDVEAIRAADATQKELSKRFGISQGTVSEVRNWQIWRAS